MSKTVLIILILIVVILLAIGIYYFLFVGHSIKIGPSGNLGSPQKTQQLAQPPVLPDPAKQLAAISKDYPEVITGVINFFDTKNSFKATLKTDSGTEYILWPAQPEAIYESLGAKEGGRVQVNGKPLDGGKLAWALLKPI